LTQEQKDQGMTSGRLAQDKPPGIEDDEGAPRHRFSPCTDWVLWSAIVKGFLEENTR